jgi:hypothetical protein
MSWTGKRSHICVLVASKKNKRKKELWIRLEKEGLHARVKRKTQPYTRVFQLVGDCKSVVAYQALILIVSALHIEAGCLAEPWRVAIGDLGVQIINLILRDPALSLA